MKNYGLIRVAAASPRVWLADVERNAAEICSQIDAAVEKGVALLCFPELCVTGYTCADLFGQQFFISKAEDAVRKIVAHTADKNITVVIGAPVRHAGRLFNCAIVICNGWVNAIVPKTFLPNYSEFYEARWFASAEELSRAEGENFVDYAGFRTRIAPNLLFSLRGTRAVFAVELCEDLWTPIPPSASHALAGANIILNLSASNENIGKHAYRKSMVSAASSKSICAYVYASSGYGESTQDIVFGGSSLIYEYGSCMAENERFCMESRMIIADVDVEKLDNLRAHSNTFYALAPDGRRYSAYAGRYTEVPVDIDMPELFACATASDDAAATFRCKLLRRVDAHPFVPQTDPAELDARCREITSIQVLGLATRLAHINSKTAVIGISGGLDSTLALLITVMAFDKLGWSRERIIGVTMPGLGTTVRTHSNANDLMTALGITQMEVSIVPAVKQHFQDIGQDPDNHDLTYENSQARERTQLLMDIAGKNGGIVVGTGDLSELALGWATYNGDHMSMYGVNGSIPKTLVRSLVAWAADNCFSEAAVVLKDIIDTPISPELIPASADGTISQITEDLVGPYELHDFFLYNFFRFGYSPTKIKFLAGVAFDGVYTGEVIDKWLRNFVRRFFAQQFKRSCLPDGPKVGSVSLSPRGDWRMPSDSFSATWLSDLE